jgi:hypothetical protein
MRALIASMLQIIDLLKLSSHAKETKFILESESDFFVAHKLILFYAFLKSKPAF